MSKLNDLILQYCPDGVEWKTLGEVCEVLTGGEVPDDAIKKDGRVTAKSLAGTLAVRARTIERELTFLKNKGIIRKEGKSNKGVWIILQ